MTKRKLTRVSPAETEILRLVWQLKKATVQEVHDRLPPGRNIANATVQTLLRRLEKKGYVKHHVRGKAHVFFPVVRKEAVIKRSVNDLIDRLFGGDPVPLIQHLAEHAEISPDDVKRLKRITEER